MLSKIATLAAFAVGALAHGTVNGVTIDGKFEQGFLLDYYYSSQNGQTPAEHIGWYAENLDNGFIEPNSFGEADVICHKAGSPKLSSDTMAKVAAGGTVEFHWTTWPESHMGPVITYVAPYTGDVTAVDKTSLKWTKIQADGYADGQWAAIKMIGQNNTWPVTVPASLAAGKYVFRHEIIALHGASDVNGAQAYPQCVNIEVTGSGTDTPEGVVGTSLYTATEDGIVFNPYAATIDYNIPGPALWTGGSGSGSSPAPTTPSNGTSSAAPTVTATPTAPASSAVASAPAATSVAAEATPTSSSAPAPSSGAELPKTFTIETFIAWLEQTAGSSSNTKARRHARALFF
ncbi:lytic polysaccharide monooxygenase [Didymella exigua CBS 183.55]|uniref:Lytic polysaccharide monooxygenase n=1 Tax=Didymella exigua CBS 183.55 TaxID=1150837 RepID=A0A6A5RST2_9PLEO|nr:lytic polysaccharide monooxygenase [Didymella exigua CBS 183.55]KAF1930410.1 lytic polysaccharide monooxygenase [Didymella exigua CBS 183.55]